MEIEKIKIDKAPLELKVFYQNLIIEVSTVIEAFLFFLYLVIAFDFGYLFTFIVGPIPIGLSLLAKILFHLLFGARIITFSNKDIDILFPMNRHRTIDKGQITKFHIKIKWLLFPYICISYVDQYNIEKEYFLSTVFFKKPIKLIIKDLYSIYKLAICGVF